jgi:hypothetical protein
MIHKHLIARWPQTPVYLSPEQQSAPQWYVARGSWLGVLDDQGEWIHVIAVDGEGWVRKDDVESLPPMKLHVVWSPGEPIHYVSAAS